MQIDYQFQITENKPLRYVRSGRSKPVLVDIGHQVAQGTMIPSNYCKINLVYAIS